MLTNLECKKAKSLEKPYKLKDEYGLFLYVTPKSKIWRFRYKRNKKDTIISLGKFPLVSLQDARIKRDEMRRQLIDKTDPVLERKKRYLEEKIGGDTFRDIYNQWFKNHALKCKPKNIKIIKNALEKNIIGTIGDIPAKEITPPMILAILRKVEEQSVDKARRIRMWISAVFRYGIAIGFCQYDPAANLINVMKPLKKGKQPAITNIDELKKMMFVLDSYPCHPITKLAMRFLALTALRSGEIRSISWGDVHEDILEVPAEKMKMKRPHIVPLARQALEVLEAVKPLTYNAPYIFPSIRFSYKKMSDMTLSVMLKRCGYQGRHVPHGFRSSFSSIMNERRPQDRYIIDLMLAHVNRNNVEASYNRSEHLELRRDIAQEWADLICDDLVPAKELIG